ncbi:hypothetical protein RD055328_01410 [Companilactobacillus sp. RD055328]|uniref:hypothetical protein n=1 Tax=Companilactobacillus sp. RD055328 TaxID=2916634 RepID=UPI001FC86652|nr:hypothetical protein [Companilactobacillus sp. RD055328]GKQ42218.1 hypothetical protein RD055328_01410 [Companilactobacillus sp. RD055328]
MVNKLDKYYVHVLLLSYLIINVVSDAILLNLNPELSVLYIIGIIGATISLLSYLTKGKISLVMIIIGLSILLFRLLYIFPGDWMYWAIISTCIFSCFFLTRINNLSELKEILNVRPHPVAYIAVILVFSFIIYFKYQQFTEMMMKSSSLLSDAPRVKNLLSQHGGYFIDQLLFKRGYIFFVLLLGFYTFRYAIALTDLILNVIGIRTRSNYKDLDKVISAFQKYMDTDIWSVSRITSFSRGITGIDAHTRYYSEKQKDEQLLGRAALHTYIYIFKLWIILVYNAYVFLFANFIVPLFFLYTLIRKLYLKKFQKV